MKRFERQAFTLARELSQAGSERFGSPMWFIRCLGAFVARKFVVERNHPESKREVLESSSGWWPRPVSSNGLILPGSVPGSRGAFEDPVRGLRPHRRATSVVCMSFKSSDAMD